MQCFDLLLQRFTLGGQAPDDVVISLLGFPLESSGLRLGILGYLLRPRPRIGEDLFGVSSSAVGMCLGVSDYLLRHGARIGQHFGGFPPSAVGMCPGVARYLLCRCPGIRPDSVSLVLSAGDMLVSCPLGENQHLKGSLGVWIGMVRRPVGWRARRGSPS